ncbi:MAG: flippase-like domain-containing protein [bacterium]|nr:flippase-like domain-containing protein [bacterium]
MGKRLVAGLLIAAVFFALLLRRIDPHQVGVILRQAHWPFLLLVMFLLGVSLFLKGERWSVAIAAGAGARPRKRLFAATVIGTAANCVLPVRLGDVLRAMVLRKHNHVPATRALFANWSAQSFDVLAVALLLLAGVASGKDVASGNLLAFVIIAVLAAVAAIGTLARRPQLLARWARWLPGGHDAKPAQLARDAASGLRFLGEPAVLLRVVSYTVAVWTFEVGSIWLALKAFNIELGIAAPGLLVAATGLSFALPLTPGNIGTYQVITILVLGFFGVDYDRAFAFGIGYQGFALFATVAIGLVFFQREGLSLHDLKVDTASADAKASSPS